jgi:hypothetical protein
VHFCEFKLHIAHLNGFFDLLAINAHNVRVFMSDD